MKLKKIILNNIRSYENQEINFPEGSTLLSGDIGSGKTSILLGIEFALFGTQPGQKGSALLRNGKNSGRITLEFEINGKEIIIERNLKKGKTISQDTCYATIDGSKTQLSVMELKSLILEMLNYPKEFSKKQNLLYKFTVYTPQEEMKQIIMQDSETRTNTIRYIFGIEKYKQIIENAGIVSSKIREEKRVMESVVLGFESDREELAKKENEISENALNLISIEKEFLSVAEERKKRREEMDKILEKVEKKNMIAREIEKNRIIISGKKENISNNLDNMEQFKNQVEILKKLGFDASEIFRIEEDVSMKKKNKEELGETLLKVSSEINSLAIRNQENQIVKERIIHIENCPTCLQKVNLDYKKNIFSKIELEMSKNNENISILNAEREKLLGKIKEINGEILSREKKVQELNILSIRVRGIEEKKMQMQKIQELNHSLEKEIEELNLRINILADSLSEFEGFEELLKQKKLDFDDASRKERIAEIKLAELKREILVLSKYIEVIKEKLRKSEEIKRKINYLVEIENWISTDFINLVSLIEKNIMIKLKSEFSRIFSEWFSMLVSESFNVYVRDDFTPVIELQDYELDYPYLSGGERTAVALAYRLALNQLINSVLSNIETKDIVILDEPTDGFSDQQLDKMRDVLNQLNVKQLIIVSHEQKIEGFVENIIKLSKEDGISRIEF